jgi:hypothetical protein
MKIRYDYVTNSSSTSFVIICKGFPDKKAILSAIGVTAKSPLKPFFDEMCEVLFDKITNAQEAIKGGYWGPENDVVTLIKKNISESTAIRANKAICEGKDVWIGKLDSSGDTVESFFCCESFEIDEPDLYINSLNCVW